MARAFAAKFYASEKWHKARLGYISHRRAVDGGMCEECHERLGYIVHHKEHLSPRNIEDPAISLGFDNLEYVCKICHEKIHENGEEFSNRRRVVFDAAGNPIPGDSPS